MTKQESTWGRNALSDVYLRNRSLFKQRALRSAA